MSRTARHRRVRPYAWLGSGAVTVGLGAALLSGAAVAGADTGAGPGTDAGADAASTSRDASPPSGAPAAAKPGPGAGGKAGASRRGSAGPAEAEPGSAAVSSAAAEKTRDQRPANRLRSAAVSPAGAAQPDQQSDQQSDPTALTAIAQPVVSPAAAAPLPAAAPPPPGPDPSYNMDSYLPVAPIVPGTRVQLALQQIQDAQNDLSQEVMNSGNVVAALVAVAPQLLLAQSSWTLNAWRDSMPAATQWVEETADIPFLHQVAQVNLLATMALPTLSEAGLVGAALLLPLVNLLGVATATTQGLVGQARSNGQVYAWLPVQMKATTQPVINISVNGGSRVPVLVDTGASGLIVTPDVLGPGSLGSPIGSGNSCFSGGLCYHYETYNTTVDFGGAAVTGPTPVNVVTNNAAYPNSVAEFKDCLLYTSPSPRDLSTSRMPSSA